MSVHYKFKSALEYDTVTFDGLHITVKDLKNAIIQQKRIGKNTDFDLQVTNAQTKEVYEDEETLIPKNTSLLIARIPVIPSNKSKTWEGYGNDNAPVTRTDEGGPIAKAVDLSSLDASEDDKIRAMMSQSTQDYDPSNYQKIRGANQVGTVPPNYRCYKCHQTGHWIKDCPLSQGTEPMEIKKSTGIPRSFMVPVDGPQVQGAMMTPNGSYAVPVLDHQTYTQKQQPAPPPAQEEQPEIPEDLICSICSGLLSDAVMIPCCGNSFCDECIRSCLLESEDHECPDCHERDISPGTLIPNRYLRNSVANFKNTTGYVKKPTYKPLITQQTQSAQIEKDKKEDVTKTTPSETDPADSLKSELVEKAVISEADSTEPPKNTNIDFSKDIDLGEMSKESPSKSSVPEGPPGVSPRREKSPKRPNRRGSHSSTHQSRSRRNSKDNMSPRPHNTRRSPPYEPMSRIEERPGTPTVDEPGGSNVSSNVYPPTSAPYPSAPPPGVLPPMIGMPPPHMQGPPPNYSSGQPPPNVFPSQGPPPNFRLPPPGANNSAPYMSGPYTAPPRPIFDPSRPPLQGPPPSYSNYPPRSRNRDFRESNRMRTRTPPGIIDDPLEAFNRMLREKDERDRRAKQKKGRSYSRSSSRSYSRSPKRPRSRSPRRRNSRSRSRSFSMSRSRSRSFSPSPRNSPYRDYSPRNSSPRRRPASRFRSPARSPPPRYRYKDGPINDRNRDRDFDRPPQQRDRDRGFSRDRDFNYFERDRGGPRWGGAPPSRPPPLQDNYYPPDVHQLQPPPPSNRYPPRDNYQPPPFVNKNEPPHHMPPLLPPPNVHVPPQRRFDDIAPPGTDQPPIPGEEIPPRYDDRYGYQQDAPNKEQFNNDREPGGKEDERRNFDNNKIIREEDKPRRFDRFSRSPARAFKSPRKSRERHESPDKHKRRKREHSEERERDKREDRHEKKREVSDDEKAKRSKEKKKKREKKEMEKKKRKEKKERKEHDKAKKEDKEKKRDKDESGDMGGIGEKYLVNKDKKEEKIISKTPEKPKELVKFEKPAKVEEPPDLYDDVLSDGVDKSIMKNYGKLETVVEEDHNRKTPEIKKREETEDEYKEDNEYPPESETSKDEDVLDIHANESELKAELDKTEVLAPIPEKSKWEMDDEVTLVSVEVQKEGKQDRNGKVTNEVLKRAENAIFAKAINAIRPIEIKKISMDRAKLYSGEREKDRKVDEQDIRNIQVTISSNSPFEEEDIHPPGTDTVKVESEIQKPPPRLSVKDRLGVKVDDLDRIVKVAYERNLSRSLSPLSKRAREERIHIDRRIEMDDRRRDDRGRHERDRYHRNYRNLDRNEFRRREEFMRRERERREEQRREERRGRSRSQKDEAKRKRSRTRSESKEHKHRKKDKKQRKEKGKKHKRDDKDDSKSKEEAKGEKRESSVKPKSATDRRKPTLDEANFEPDYDLDTESEKEDKKSPKDLGEEEKKRLIKLEEKEQKESSSSESSESSSEDDRKRKKHRKHKKKKSRKDSSSSSSSSETDSSEEERERKRRKHKRKQKKRKKSKHK